MEWKGQLLNRSNKKLLIIAASEGGPPVVHAILSQIGRDFAVPIVICQVFESGAVQPLVNAWDRTSQVSVREARNQVRLEGGVAYVVPCHGRSMVENDEDGCLLLLDEGYAGTEIEGEEICEFLVSASREYGDGLRLVLAGSLESRIEVLISGIQAVHENSGLVQCVQDSGSAILRAANEKICERTGVVSATTDSLVADLYDWTGKQRKAGYPAWL